MISANFCARIYINGFNAELLKSVVGQQCCFAIVNQSQIFIWKNYDKIYFKTNLIYGVELLGLLNLNFLRLWSFTADTKKCCKNVRWLQTVMNTNITICVFSAFQHNSDIYWNRIRRKSYIFIYIYIYICVCVCVCVLGPIVKICILILCQI